MVSLTIHARRQSDATLHLCLPDLAQHDRILPGGRPFVLWRVGDQPLLYHWLDHAVNEGYSRVVLYSRNAHLQIRRALRAATLWPLEWEIVEGPPAAEGGWEWLTGLPEKNRPSPARLKDRWALVDHWFEMERVWLSDQMDADPDLSLMENGIGRWCQIHPSVKIHQPVWIGDNVKIGPESEIGPFATIGGGSVLNGANRVVNSKIAENTFLGKHTELDQCFLDGGYLINRKHRGCVPKVEPFIAGTLVAGRRKPLFRERITAAWLWCRIASRYGPKVWGRSDRESIRNHDGRVFRTSRSSNLLVNRAPLLLDVVRGRLALYGVRPRSREFLDGLDDERRAMIEEAPVGVFGLADLERASTDDEEATWAVEQVIAHPEDVKRRCRKMIRGLLSRRSVGPL